MPWHFSALLLTINTLGYDCDEPPRGEITKAESSRREIRRRVFRVFALFIADAALVFFLCVSALNKPICGKWTRVDRQALPDGGKSLEKSRTKGFEDDVKCVAKDKFYRRQNLRCKCVMGFVFFYILCVSKIRF